MGSHYFILEWQQQFFVQPLDLVKNRMQLSGVGGAKKQYKTSFHALASILKNEGVTGIYTGLSAGLLRQATYTTTRLGIYTSLFDMMSRDGKLAKFHCKSIDWCNSWWHWCFRWIVREEGAVTLWRGCIPTVGRAMVVNAAQLASYSQAKQILISTGYFQDGLFLHFVASMISGLITTAASMPVDIAKTRIQNMKTVNGKPEYSGAVDVLSKTIRQEGLFSLWKGFTPYYAFDWVHIQYLLLFSLNR
ncbi:hypothetical protein Btru_018151 [Bulinus truncatus]|nr:hypothetical protein Btru_018151 [Bulinus truncatus]